ncbi:MAG: hypothetical protein NTX38_14475 [Methylobacter sp.]|nr:hypothetical protein [Methylobacter sp.]
MLICIDQHGGLIWIVMRVGDFAKPALDFTTYGTPQLSSVFDRSWQLIRRCTPNRCEPH